MTDTPNEKPRNTLLAKVAGVGRVSWWLTLCLVLGACGASLGDLSSPLWLWQAYCAALWLWVGALTRRVDRLSETCGTGREPDEVIKEGGVTRSFWYSRKGGF